MEQTASPLLESAIAQFGAVGVLVIVLIVILYMAYKHIDKMSVQHNEERGKRMEKFEQVAKHNNEAIEGLKSVITDLTIFIKSKR